MSRYLIAIFSLSLVVSPASAQNTECNVNMFEGTHQSNMGAVKCTASSPQVASCCYGKNECNSKLFLNIGTDGTITGNWLNERKQRGKLEFEVTAKCELVSARGVGGDETEEWQFGEPKRNSQGCSLEDVAEFYKLGRGRDLECRAAGGRLNCCQVKLPLVRPERFASFDPLNPPTDIHSFDSPYKKEEPQCNEHSLSLELEGERMVGWKNFTAPSNQRPEVSLPLDAQCRLTNGTINDGEEKPFPISLDLSRANIKSGDPENQYEIAEYWMRQNEPRVAVSHFAAAARDGHVNAQLELARLFEHGTDGVWRNLEEAQRLYLLAAEQGSQEAQQKVEERSAVLRKFEKLVELAEGGDAERQYNLAALYVTGEYVDTDWEKAAYWLKEASDRGHAAAIGQLGWWYALGIGGLQSDKATALQLLERSMELGNDWAMISMARVIYDGIEEVATKDFEDARTLLWRAQNSSDPEVASAATYWLSLMQSDQKAVGTRNVIEQRREQIEAMERANNAFGNAAHSALQNLD